MRLGFCGLAAIAAGLPLAGVSAAEVKDARVWAGPDYTRVVFDLSGPVRHTISTQDGQIQLVLDGSQVAGDFDAPAAQGLFKGLSSTRRGNDLRLLARAGAGAKPKVFLLGPGGTSGYRLVLDLYPGDQGAAVASGTRVNAAATRAQADAASDEVAAQAAGASIQPLRNRRASTQQAATLLHGSRQVIVAIDAGHGGEDPGAHGPGGTLEKNVTLAVAHRLADDINRQPGMKAVLTRNGDYFIPLKRRYQIAREHSADMFVSIHADAFKSGDAKGSSVWVLSPRGKTNEAARWLADRENRADLIGGASLDNMDDSLAAVLVDMQQGWAMRAGESIAGNVLKALGLLGPTHRGYVERANFVVLRSPDVPSILVETAFISNPAEERKLRDPDHQAELAKAVMGGVKNYFEASPPDGSWFAAQAAKRNGLLLSSADGANAAPAAAGKTAVAAAARAVADTSTASARADANVSDLHRVGRGESLRSIARQYGVSVGALKSANGIDADRVRAGAVLTIPAS